MALARAIAIKPRALLLDEPLSALDAKIRVKLRDDIRSIQRKLGITTIYVTHDQEEALSISDRVAVMKEGLIEQIGAPFEIYNRPATPYVASFIGTLNVLEATVLDPVSGQLRVEGQTLSAGRSLDFKAGEKVRLSVRPEAFSLDSSADNHLDGEVVNIKLLGSIVRLIVLVGERELSVDGFNEPSRQLSGIGERVRLGVAPESLIVTKAEGAAVPAVAEDEEA